MEKFIYAAGKQRGRESKHFGSIEREGEGEVYLGDIMQAQVYSEVTTELAQKFTIFICFRDHLG